MRHFPPFFVRSCRRLGILACLLLPGEASTIADTPVEERLRQIQKLLQQGSWEDARNQLADALRQFPGRLPSTISWEWWRRRPATIRQLKPASAGPWNCHRVLPGAAINLGRLYQENLAKDAKARVKAFQVYQRILAYDPANAEALFQTAVLSLQQGQYRAALASLARLPCSECRSARNHWLFAAPALPPWTEQREAEKAAEVLLVHPDLTAADVLLVLPALEKKMKSELEERLLEGLTSRSLHTPESLRESRIVL